MLPFVPPRCASAHPRIMGFLERPALGRVTEVIDLAGRTGQHPRGHFELELIEALLLSGSALGGTREVDELVRHEPISKNQCRAALAVAELEYEPLESPAALRSREPGVDAEPVAGHRTRDELEGVPRPRASKGGVDDDLATLAGTIRIEQRQGAFEDLEGVSHSAGRAGAVVAHHVLVGERHQPSALGDFDRARHPQSFSAIGVSSHSVDPTVAGLIGVVLGAVLSVAGTWWVSARLERRRDDRRLYGILGLLASELKENQKRLEANPDHWDGLLTLGNWDANKAAFSQLVRDEALWEGVTGAYGDIFEAISGRRDPPSVETLGELYTRVVAARAQLKPKTTRHPGH